MTAKQKEKIRKKAEELYPDYKVSGTFDSHRYLAFVIGAQQGFDIGFRSGVKKTLSKYKLDKEVKP